MDWMRRDRYYFESDNGKYRISIAYVSEQCVYTAWRCGIRHGETVWSSILYTRDLSQAQQACEEDLNVG